MIIEINYLQVAILAALFSALAGGLWAVGRTFLQQYGTMLRDQLTAHRAADAAAAQELSRRLGEIEASVDASIASHAGRLTRLEGLADRSPSHADLSVMYDKLNATAGTVAAMSGQVHAMNETLRLILGRITEKGLQ